MQIFVLVYKERMRETYNREISGLIEAMKQLSVFESTLIIGDGTRSIVPVDKFQILIIPAWQWLLEN